MNAWRTEICIATWDTCLFLRMAIWALAFSLLDTYRSEVDFAGMRK